ncbi:nucleoside recognition domain-containing protein [Caminibacter sp.]
MEVFKKALKSSLLILKYVVPIYILADILYYYNILSYVSFIFEPITKLLDLPKETSLAIISGVFLNLYAAIAFAAPIDLSAKEWSILAIFLGVCHSLLVESAILKKIGISVKYSFLLRILGGFIIAYIATFIPDSFFGKSTNAQFQKIEYASFFEMIYHSLFNALILSFKIIVLITVLIFVMEGIKRVLKNFNVSKTFSIVVGLFLGITYGAAILIEEAKNLKKSDIFFIATFLSICHSIIEDPLLFVIFGANFWLVVTVRLIFAFIFAYFLTKLFFKHT